MVDIEDSDSHYPFAKSSKGRVYALEMLLEPLEWALCQFDLLIVIMLFSTGTTYSLYMIINLKGILSKDNSGSTGDLYEHRCEQHRKHRILFHESLLYRSHTGSHVHHFNDYTWFSC